MHSSTVLVFVIDLLVRANEHLPDEMAKRLEELRNCSVYPFLCSASLFDALNWLDVKCGTLISLATRISYFHSTVKVLPFT